MIYTWSVTHSFCLKTLSLPDREDKATPLTTMGRHVGPAVGRSAGSSRLLTRGFNLKIDIFTGLLEETLG